MYCGMPGFPVLYYLPAAAAAKSLQSCLTLCNPIDSSPLGSSVPGIFQARILEWVAISFSNAWKWKAKVKSLSHTWLLATPWTVAHQAPPSMGFSRQEYWSGLPLPSPTIYIHIYLYTYIYIYIHTYIHIHTHFWCIYVYTHTMEYYSVIKKKEILPFATTWKVLWLVKSDRERQILYIITHMWNLKNKTNYQI